MATAYEVDQWKDRCRRLTALLDKSRNEKEALTRRIRDNSEEAKTARALADGLEWEVEDLKVENEKLRELVRDMWDVALHPQLFGDGSYLLRRMCDLGIEDDS